MGLSIRQPQRVGLAGVRVVPLTPRYVEAGDYGSGGELPRKLPRVHGDLMDYLVDKCPRKLERWLSASDLEVTG